MSKVKVVLNDAGIKELLKSAAVAEVCEDYAKQSLAQCGEHYTMQQRDYPERTGYAVLASDFEGIRDNSKNNTLLKALGR